MHGIEFLLDGVKQQVLSFVWKGVTYAFEVIGNCFSLLWKGVKYVFKPVQDVCQKAVGFILEVLIAIAKSLNECINCAGTRVWIYIGEMQQAVMIADSFLGPIDQDHFQQSAIDSEQPQNSINIQFNIVDRGNPVIQGALGALGFHSMNLLAP